MPKSVTSYVINKFIPRTINSISETLSSAADGVSNVASSVTKSVADGTSNLVEWVGEVAEYASNKIGSQPQTPANNVSNNYSSNTSRLSNEYTGNRNPDNGNRDHNNSIKPEKFSGKVIKNEVDKFLREDVTQSSGNGGTSKQNNREIQDKAQKIADSYKGQIRDNLMKDPLNPKKIWQEFKSSNGGYREEVKNRAREHTNNPSKEFQYNPPGSKASRSR